MLRPVTILCGPTASGKTALAIRMAKAWNGVIINADSMQVYKGIPVLTAMPTAEEFASAPHRLFSYLDPATPSSVAAWLEAARIAVYETWQEGKLPILTGGTGMYLKSLMEGLAPIPEISSEIREKARTTPLDEAFAELSRHDPTLDLKQGDSQRIARAYEVLLQTGKPLPYWQQQPTLPPLPDAKFHVFALNLPRESLYARCNQRLETMIKNGALDELQTLLDRNLSPELPAMRAVGVPELTRHLRGEWTLEEATEKAQQATRNYAKRQLTWIRNQLPSAIALEYPYETLPAPPG